MKRHQQGAVLPTAAAILMLLMLLGSLIWGTSYRIAQKQRLESALRESTRSAGQLWNYPSLATNQPQLRVVAQLEQHARSLLHINLANVPGLVDAPGTAAKQASWNILAPGATCGGEIYAQAVLCGKLDVAVRSLPLGFPGTSRLHLESAVILDSTH